MSARDEVLKLREAVSVPDALMRDDLVRAIRRHREHAVQIRADAIAWNAAHPNEEPITHFTEDAVIAWCDGKGTPADIERAVLADRGIRTYGSAEAAQ